MTTFHRIAAIVRCWFTNECPADLPTRDETIRYLREQEVAAETAATEIRERVRVRERANAVIEQMLNDVVAANRRGGGAR